MPSTSCGSAGARDLSSRGTLGVGLQESFLFGRGTGGSLHPAAPPSMELVMGLWRVNRQQPRHDCLGVD